MQAKSMPLVGAAILTLCLLPCLVQAEMLTFAMEGTVSTISDPLGLIGFAHIGDRVVYTFTVDTDVAIAATQGGSGTYDGVSASILVGSQSIPTELPIFSVQSNSFEHQSDQFEVYSPIHVGTMNGAALFNLHDYSGTGLPDSDWPFAPYDLSRFAWTPFDFLLFGPPSPGHPTSTNLTFSGMIDSFYEVPEPSSAVCLLLSLTLLVNRRS